MRISDWSSDVCSSDLWRVLAFHAARDVRAGAGRQGRRWRQLAVAQGRGGLCGNAMEWRADCHSTAELRRAENRRNRSGCARRYLRWWRQAGRSEEHTSELQSLMRISYAVFCLKKKRNNY